MIKDIYKNLDKFEFTNDSEHISNFKYKEVRIEIVKGFIGVYYNLYYAEDIISLNIFERLMFNRAVEKLIKIKNIKSKNKVKKIMVD